jgi:hypothetical protein
MYLNVSFYCQDYLLFMATLTTTQIQEANHCKSRLHRYMRTLDEMRAHGDREGEERVQEQIGGCQDELDALLRPAPHLTQPTLSHAQHAADSMHQIIGHHGPLADDSNLDRAARERRFAEMRRMTNRRQGGSNNSQRGLGRDISYDPRGKKGPPSPIDLPHTQPGPHEYGGNSHDIVDAFGGSIQARTPRKSRTVPSAGFERPNVDLDPPALSLEETNRDQAKLINKGMAIQSAYRVQPYDGVVSDIRVSSGHTGSNLLNLIISMDCVRAMDNQRNMLSMTTSLLQILFRRFDISFTTLRVPFRSSEITEADINWLAEDSGTDVIVLSWLNGDGLDLLYKDSRDLSVTSKKLTKENIDETQLRESMLLYFNRGFLYRLYVDDREAREVTVLHEPTGAQV